VGDDEEMVLSGVLGRMSALPTFMSALPPTTDIPDSPVNVR